MNRQTKNQMMAGLTDENNIPAQKTRAKDIMETVGDLYYTIETKAHDVEANKLTTIPSGRLAMIVADEMHQLDNRIIAHAYTLLISGNLFVLMCVNDLTFEGFSSVDGGIISPETRVDKEQSQIWCELAGISTHQV